MSARVVYKPFSTNKLDTSLKYSQEVYSRVSDYEPKLVSSSHFELFIPHFQDSRYKKSIKQMLVQQQGQGQEPPDPVDSILECCLGTTTTTTPRLRSGLRPGVTLHLYTSSAPCLKKFATMANQAELFREDLRADGWPIVGESDRSHK